MVTSYNKNCFIWYNIFLLHFNLDHTFLLWISTMTQCSSCARTNPSESSSQSNVRKTTPTPQKHVILMSTAQIHKCLNNSNLSVYIGSPVLPSTSLFHLGGPIGDYLISTHSHNEMILCGVFQISCSDCFLSSNGSFQPTNSIWSSKMLNSPASSPSLIMMISNSCQRLRNSVEKHQSFWNTLLKARQWHSSFLLAVVRRLGNH